MQTHAFVAAVDQAMREAIEPYVGTFAGGVLSKTAVAATGKRVRSRLIGVAAADLGIDAERVVPLAAAAEMVHAGSLQHDDVLDDADTRRGVAATHVQFGNHLAILGGDLLLALSVGQVADGPQTWTAESAKTLAAMSAAASDEILWRDKATPCPLAQWEDIARGKTGALFRFCLGGTGILVSEERYRTMSHFGERLGILYQWVDDLLDFRPRTGKRRYADLFEHNPNRVVSRAAAAGDFVSRVVNTEAEAEAIARALQPHWDAECREALAEGRSLAKDMAEAGLDNAATVLVDLMGKLERPATLVEEAA